MNTKINEKQLLRMHLDPNNRREEMTKPHSLTWGADEYIGATDTHTAIIIPATDANRIKQIEGKPLNIGQILPDDAVKFCSISTEHVNSKLYSHPRMVSCESCDGYGSFEHYWFKYQCKPCDGTGYVDNTALVKIQGLLFRYKSIDRLIRSAELTQCQTIAIFTSENRPLTVLFQLEFGVWVIMPNITDVDGREVIDCDN